MELIGIGAMPDAAHLHARVALRCAERDEIDGPDAFIGERDEGGNDHLTFGCARHACRASSEEDTAGGEPAEAHVVIGIGPVRAIEWNDFRQELIG